MKKPIDNGVHGRVLVTAKSVAQSQKAIALMQEAGHEVIVQNTPAPTDDAWLVEQVRDIDALVFAMEPMNAAVIGAANRLKLIARPGVGYDNVDLEAATRNGVIVSIAAGANDQSVADFTFALILEAMRGVSRASASVQAHGWQRFTGTEAWRKKICVVGLGRIGRGVVKRARGFDMEVLAVCPRPDLDFGREQGVRFCSLDEALAQADIVTLHLPLDHSTRHMINARTLAQMKRGVYLINTSRGGLLDEEAVVQAIRSGHLAGVAVDVLQQQGVGSPSCLIDVEGITVTPHMAAFTHESIERVAMSVAESIINALAGRMPRHVVNPAAWA